MAENSHIANVESKLRKTINTIAHLERKNERYRLLTIISLSVGIAALALSLVTLGSALLSSSPPQVSGNLTDLVERIDRLEQVASSGESNNIQPTPTGILDDEGTLVVKGLRIVDDDGKARVYIGQGGMVFLDGARAPRIMIVEGTITTFDAEGNQLVSLGVTEGGNGSVTTFDSEGNELVSLGVLEGGNGEVRTFDAKGSALVTMSSATDGSGMVVVFDPSGRYRRGALTVE